MKFITVTELKNRATQIVTEIGTAKEVVVVTKNGKPIGVMRYITDKTFSIREYDKGKIKS